MTIRTEDTYMEWDCLCCGFEDRHGVSVKRSECVSTLGRWVIPPNGLYENLKAVFERLQPLIEKVASIDRIDIFFHRSEPINVDEEVDCSFW